MVAELSRREWLNWAVACLSENGIETPHLDAELILGSIVGVDRVSVIAHDEEPLAPAHAESYRSHVEERAAGKPLAYITGAREFFGLEIAVSPAVLIPRPETELIVEWGLEWCRSQGLDQPAILDVGTGSGCIAVALAKNCVGACVVATDISPLAIKLARQNAEKHGVSERIEFVETDLISGIHTQFDLIVSNPPYVSKEDPLLDPGVAAHEPALALLDTVDGDGLGYYRRLSAAVNGVVATHGAVIVEVGEEQSASVSTIFQHAGFLTTVRRDLASIERVLLARPAPQ